MTQPKLWTIEFHHRHGVTFFVVASETKPSEDDVELFLESEDGYEKDREDEYFTVEAAQVVSPKQFADIVKAQKEANDA
jgi:hypothetical protein